VATSAWRDLTDYGGACWVDNSLHSTTRARYLFG
jgi:hypothetical protein